MNGRRHFPLLTGLLLVSPLASPADPALLEKGRAEEKRCAGCHGLRIIATQRLNRTGWERELDKMVRWGAEIKEREAILTYLTETYGEDKPVTRTISK
jgi:hypothetical protein